MGGGESIGREIYRREIGKRKREKEGGKKITGKNWWDGKLFLAGYVFWRDMFFGGEREPTLAHAGITDDNQRFPLWVNEFYPASHWLIVHSYLLCYFSDTYHNNYVLIWYILYFCT